jgi:threonine dehydrogenase-like Zn-dependent dehydrogenase
VPLAFYHGDARGLRLGEEWHMNRIDMISSRACSDPNREHPRWDDHRIRQVAFDLIRTGRVNTQGIVHPIVPFDEALEAYRMLDEHPETAIKLGVVYP